MNPCNIFKNVGKNYLFYSRMLLSCSRMSTNPMAALQSQKEIFQDVLPVVIDSLVTSPKFSELPEIASWVKKVIEYNLTGGKKLRGLTTIYSYEMLEQPEKVTKESLRQASVMGWCVELMQAYLLVLDDIMDGSVTRRGLPCWYRTPGVGLGAVNDSILIQMSLYHILKTHFNDRGSYSQMVELFNETLLYTSMGQHIDYTMAHRTKNDYSLFTPERYDSIVKYKTAYYTFKLPVCLGMLLANISDNKLHSKVEDICFDIGTFFQMQDDYIDCFSEESISGKAGTDIQEGKCSWLAVNALKRCNNAQRIVFNTCYGSQEPAHIERIKQLYIQLKLPEIYTEVERKKYEEVIKKTQELQKPLSPKLFVKLIDMINKRKM